MRTDGKFEHRWSVAEESIVDENFRAVRIGSDGDGAVAFWCGKLRCNGGGRSLRSEGSLRGIFQHRNGGFLRGQGELCVGIEAAKHGHEVGSAKGETDAIGVFLDEF